MGELLNRQKYKLVDFLSKTFPKQDDAEMILRDLSINQKSIILEGSSSARWNNIIEYVKSKNKLYEILDGLGEIIELHNDGVKEQFTVIKDEITSHTAGYMLPHLHSIILEGKCVLFLGPDAFKCENDNKVIPFTTFLAEKLAEMLSSDNLDIFYEESQKGNLSYLIDRYESREKAAIGDTKAFALTQYEAMTPYPNIYEYLEKLNFPLIVNTNPDLLFGKKNEQDFVHLRYDQTNTHSQELPADFQQKRIVYNIYGSFANTQSILFTENEAVKFTKAAYQKNPPILEEVKAIAKESYGLFVGFNFRDWPIKILFDVLDLKNKPGNYSINETGIEDQHIEYFSKLYNMTFITDDMKSLKTLSNEE